LNEVIKKRVALKREKWKKRLFQTSVVVVGFLKEISNGCLKAYYVNINYFQLGLN